MSASRSPLGTAIARDILDSVSAQATSLFDIPGYETLANVLARAYDQAASGKGAVRHAKSQPFTHQVMQVGADQFGVGALLFQAFKKAEESQRLDHQPAVSELLGAIVYLAGAVIAMERKNNVTES